MAGLKGLVKGVMLYLEGREGSHCRRKGDFPHRRVHVAAANCDGSIGSFFHAYRPDIRHILQAGQEFPCGGIGIDFRGHVQTLQQ